MPPVTRQALGRKALPLAESHRAWHSQTPDCTHAGIDLSGKWSGSVSSSPPQRHEHPNRHDQPPPYRPRIRSSLGMSTVAMHCFSWRRIIFPGRALFWPWQQGKYSGALTAHCAPLRCFTQPTHSQATPPASVPFRPPVLSCPAGSRTSGEGAGPGSEASRERFPLRSSRWSPTCGLSP